MRWEQYFNKREKRHLREDTNQPLFQNQEMEGRRGLYSTLVETKDSLQAIRELMDEQVEGLLSQMNSALSAVPSDTPFYRTVTKTQGFIAKMKTDMGSSVDRLLRGIERDLMMQGTTLNRKNLTHNPQDDMRVGHEDWGDTGHGMDTQEIPPDAREL